MPGPGWPYSRLDMENIVRRVFEESNDRLRVNAAVTVVMGEVEVIISHVNDSIKIGDGTDFLSVNVDGSINTTPILPSGAVQKQVFNEVASVASGATTNIGSYTVPSGKVAYLQRLELSGQNIAEYTVKVNLTNIDKARTYFGGELNLNLIYQDYPEYGHKLIAGDTVVISVFNFRPTSADFNSRIQVLEV